MSSRYLVALSRDLNIADAEIGGKAAGLVAAMKAGMRVPESYVITREALRCVLSGGSLAAPWPSDVLAAITPALDALLMRAPHGLAVRSSAIYEDSAKASFAGVFESVIGVRSVDEALAAVRTCWRSSASPRALAYLERVGIPLLPDAMAVLIQPVVAPRTAGVIVTANPATGNPWQFVIHAVRGLAGDLMSGSGRADELIVDWESGRAIEAKLLGSESVLNAADIAALGDVARALDEHFGFRVDVEWAFDRELRVLQARALTALPTYVPPEAPVEGSWELAPFTIPLRSDVPPGYVTPLYADMSTSEHWYRYQPRDIVLTGIWRTERDVCGRRYVDTAPRPTFLHHLDGPAAYERWLLANEAPYRARWDQRAAELAAIVEPARAAVADKATRGSVGLAQDFLDARYRLWDMNAFGWSGPQALGWMSEATFAPFLKDIDPTLRLADLMGGETSYTFESAATLQALARGIDEPYVLDALERLPSDAVIPYLLAGLETQFLRDYESYCWAFGKTPPSWRQRPLPWRAYWDKGDGSAIRAIRAARSGDAQDVRDAQRRARLVRDAEQARVRGLIQARFPDRLARFDWVIECTRYWTQALNDRHGLATGLLWEREVLWQLAMALIGDGVLVHPEHVLLLRADALVRFARDGDRDALRRHVETSRREQRRYRRWTPPPRLNAPQSASAVTSSTSAPRLSGIGFGRGRVIGRARLVHDLDARTLDALTTDDEHVVFDANAFAYADWHSLLMLVKGVVSAARPAHHLTQVAREIGVPVIGHVTAGLDEITDGTMLELDAAAGRVRRLDE